jgi:hypothetical protein
MVLRNRPRRLFVIGLVLLALLAGAAIAAWSTSGSGNGYAKAATASALVLSDASASTSADLYPGATGTAKVKIANPNPFPVRVTSVVLTSGGTLTSNVAACNSGGTGVTFSDKTGLALDLPANASATVFTLSNAVTMSNASDNACQGAVFSIPVDVTGISN